MRGRGKGGGEGRVWGEESDMEHVRGYDSGAGLHEYIIGLKRLSFGIKGWIAEMILDLNLGLTEDLGGASYVEFCCQRRVRRERVDYVKKTRADQGAR